MYECRRSTCFEEHLHIVYKVTHSGRQVLTKYLPPKTYEHPQKSKVKTEIQYVLITTLCMFTLVHKIITMHKNWLQCANSSIYYLSIPPTNSTLYPQMLSVNFIPCILIYCQTYVNERVWFSFERFKDIIYLRLAGTWSSFIVSYTLPPSKKIAIQGLDVLYQNALLTF
jgi:hypothetical protein